MSKTVFIYSCFILVGTFISAISQVMLKKAANRKYESFLEQYLNPLVIIAYMIFFAATLLSVLAYKEIPLSMGPILEATGYFYVTIFGVKIFGETINTKKILGLMMIVLGIIIYSISG